MVLRAGDGGATRVEATGEHLWPDTVDIMGWNVDPEGFGVIFQRTIPDFVLANMNPAVTGILAPDESFDQRRRSIHLPSRRRQGGARAGNRFSLNQGALDHERDVLADYGNMSGPTVLVRARTRPRGGPAAALTPDLARARFYRELRRAAARRVSAAVIVLALVTLQRLGELVLARANTKRLMARGAVEIAAGHYPMLVAMHAAWLISLWLWGRDQAVDPLALAVFVVLQGLRLWVLATLGSRWTTRILVLPGQPLVASGPYQYLSHPNYVVVAAEIAVLPLALHLPLVAVIFTILNALVLMIRIRAEAGALAASRALSAGSTP